MRSQSHLWALLVLAIPFTAPQAPAQKIPPWTRQRFFGEVTDPPDDLVLWEERTTENPWSPDRPYDRTGVEVAVITPEPFLFLAQGAYLQASQEAMDRVASLVAEVMRRVEALPASAIGAGERRRLLEPWEKILEGLKGKEDEERADALRSAIRKLAWEPRWPTQPLPAAVFDEALRTRCEELEREIHALWGPTSGDWGWGGWIVDGALYRPGLPGQALLPRVADLLAPADPERIPEWISSPAWGEAGLWKDPGSLGSHLHALAVRCLSGPAGEIPCLRANLWRALDELLREDARLAAHFAPDRASCAGDLVRSSAWQRARLASSLNLAGQIRDVDQRMSLVIAEVQGSTRIRNQWIAVLLTPSMMEAIRAIDASIRKVLADRSQWERALKCLEGIWQRTENGTRLLLPLDGTPEDSALIDLLQHLHFDYPEREKATEVSLMDPEVGAASLLGDAWTMSRLRLANELSRVRFRVWIEGRWYWGRGGVLRAAVRDPEGLWMDLRELWN